MNHERTHLDLFSGIGGFALAANWNGVRTCGFCEREPYAQQVLRERFQALAYSDSDQLEQSERREREQRGWFGDGRPRIHPDIRGLDGDSYRGVWLITGGFPCQPFSVAGKRLGSADDRALWPEMLRVIDQARPTWVIGENVPGIITLELDRVLSDLERIGYPSRTFVVPACAVDAHHRRDRVWIVAHTSGSGLQERNLATITSGEGHAAWRNAEGRAVWEPEPAMGRVAHGIPHRAHRLRGLGNAIVPQVAAEFIRFMIATENA